MAFKVKNPFINKHTTNSQRTLGRDGRVISPLKQDHDLDPRDLNMRPIYSEVLNKGQDATLQDVSKLPDPRTAEEYDALVCRLVSLSIDEVKSAIALYREKN